MIPKSLFAADSAVDQGKAYQVRVRVQLSRACSRACVDSRQGLLPPSAQSVVKDG